MVKVIFTYHKELLLKERIRCLWEKIRCLWEQIYSFKISSHLKRAAIEEITA